MRMVSALDAGPILLQVPTPIVHDETYGELQLRLSELGALALIEALSLLDIGQITERPQDESLATFAPKIERDDARIDWTHPAADDRVRHARVRSEARSIHDAQRCRR